jgi:hypothetical protein
MAPNYCLHGNCVPQIELMYFISFGELHMQMLNDNLQTIASNLFLSSLVETYLYNVKKLHNHPFGLLCLYKT